MQKLFQTFVNVVDLVDARRASLGARPSLEQIKPVKTFASRENLSVYSWKSDRIFPHNRKGHSSPFIKLLVEGKHVSNSEIQVSFRRLLLIRKQRSRKRMGMRNRGRKPSKYNRRRRQFD